MDKNKSALEDNVTGSTSRFHKEDIKTIIYPFDKYEITIQLSSTNEFIGITEIKLNQNFLSHKQKLLSRRSQDVDEFYKD